MFSSVWSVRDRLEAVAVVVGEAQLRAGVRPLAPHDQPNALAPGRQVDPLGDLRHLAVVALGAVRVQRRDPRVLEDLEDRLADRLGQLVADREAHVALTAVVDQPVRGTRRIGPHQDLQGLEHLGRHLRKRQIDHPLVVPGGVGARVPRAQQTPHRLPGLVQVRLQRMEPVAALVVPSRVLPSRSAR